MVSINKAAMITVLLALAVLTGCADNAPADAIQSVSTTAEASVSATAETTVMKESAVTTKSAETTIKTKETVLTAHTLPADAVAQIEYENISLIQFKYDGSKTVYDESMVKDTAMIEKAKDVFINSEYYAEVLEGIRNDTDKIDGYYDTYYSEYIDNGTFVPQFFCSLTDDFDADGRTESLVALSMPDYQWGLTNRYYIVFLPSDGSGRIISSGTSMGFMGMIDYGSFRHPDISFGHNNATQKYEIFSVNGSNAKLEYRDCFVGMPALGNRLQIHDAIQQCCSLAVFWDDSDKCYKQLGGVDYDLDTFLRYAAADSRFNNEYCKDVQQVRVFGNRYYALFSEDTFSFGFTYEDGRFTRSNTGLANTHGGCVNYHLEHYDDDEEFIAPIIPTAYLDLSAYDADNNEPLDAKKR